MRFVSFISSVFEVAMIFFYISPNTYGLRREKKNYDEYISLTNSSVFEVTINFFTHLHSKQLGPYKSNMRFVYVTNNLYGTSFKVINPFIFIFVQVCTL